ncbi:hypothetical protein WMY93_001942 [Mugilogobius chulae]|uniref:Uncharacterized protein n=1 Tax=Mugilogobius chulae TaxID=88201 RepID=A0AAW0Q783_9GOBI
MGKKSDLSDFDRGLVVGARQAGLSVSEAANLLGYSRTTVSRVFREWSDKQIVSSSSSPAGGSQKTISERTTRRTLKRLGYSKTPLGTPGKPPVDPGQSEEQTEDTGQRNWTMKSLQRVTKGTEKTRQGLA